MKKIKKGAAPKKVRSPKTATPLRLEVGKTYRSRGDHFTATITHRGTGEWSFKGVADFDYGPKNSPLSWKPDGRFWIIKDDGDLIREVPAPKRRRAK